MIGRRSIKDSLNLVRFRAQEKLQEIKAKGLSPDDELSEVLEVERLVYFGCQEIVDNLPLEAKAEEKGVQ